MRTNCSQVVVENFFEPGILYLLLKKSSYGYEIKKALKLGPNVIVIQSHKKERFI